MNFLQKIWQAITTPEADTPENRLKWEKRAPGWVMICLNCNYTTPFGRFGVRLKAKSKYCRKFGRCPDCKRWGWIKIEHQ